MPQELFDEALLLYNKGFNVSYIAKEIGQPYQRLYQRLKSHLGVETLATQANYNGKGTMTSDEKKERKAKRDKYWSDLANEILDRQDGEYSELKRISEMLPPIGNDLPEKKVDAIIDNWNHRIKNNQCLKDIAECHDVSIETLKRVIYNDDRAKQ